MNSLCILIGVRALLFSSGMIPGMSVLSEPWILYLYNGKINTPPHIMPQKLHESVSESNF